MAGRSLTIAWVGGMFTQHHMEALGHRVVRLPLTAPGAFSWEDIVQRCGGAPDAVVSLDRSLPPPLLGVERYPCLTAFHCIDSHIHGWYPLYAGAFDLCAVSLKDDVATFEAELAPGRVVWLPPFAEDRCQPRAVSEADKEFDLLFVGTVDPETTPLRHAFLERLGRLLPGPAGLAVRRGDYTQLFPKARVVLNIAERGDLNFRVFEALACGSCLLTPRIGNGQGELFEDGVHLVTYAPDDEADAAEKARALLADAARRDALARAGFQAVDEAHRPMHRARALEALLFSGLEQGLAQKRLAAPDSDPWQARRQALRLLFLSWAEHCGDAALAARYLSEARTLARMK